jgi:3-(3-hydroxy-phenyl)propionate hydroxylase/flavoprotein hydroxylase
MISMSNAAAYDVAIVGYGPVGKTLALLLAKQGWNVAVYEKFPQAYPLPRAIAFDDEVARIFQSAAEIDPVMAITEPILDSYYQFRNARHETLLKIFISEKGLSYWPGSNFFNQPELERVLDEQIRKIPNIRVHTGHEVVKLEQDTDQVVLTVKDPAQREITVSARYAVGCDGANSTVKRFMRTTTTDLGFSFDWLVVDIIPHEKREWSPMIWQYCNPARPTTVMSGGPGRRRWEFMLLPNETKEELNTPDKVWQLLEPWNLHAGNATLERHAVYTFRALWADNWRDGRLLLAGDAAHLTPPFLGQGMCAGVRDAKNLSWKLDMVLSGLADASILDTYTEERKEHVATMIRIAIALGEVICVLDPEQARARDEAFLSGNVPPMPQLPLSLTKGILYGHPESGFNRGAGQLSPQDEVQRGEKRGLYDDVVGQGWSVISFKEHPKSVLRPEQIATLEKLGTHFVHMSPDPGEEGKVADLHGTYAKFMEEHGFEAIVVRPDYYLFGGVGTMEELPDLADDWIRKIPLRQTIGI